MVRIVVVGLLLVFALPARADEQVTKLADGYELVTTNRGVDIRKGKRRATLLVGSPYDLAAKTDAKAKKVVITRHPECQAELVDKFTFDQLEARLVNTESL